MTEENKSQRTGDNNEETNDNQVLQYDSWISAQAEPVKAMLGGHIKGLKSALESERESRKATERQLRELAGKAEAGSDAQKKLTEVADQVSEADRKADFFEAAHGAGVANLRLAYLAATTDDMFDKRGQVNFETMKTKYPELFGGKPKPPEGNAGSGTGTGQPENKSMNDFIRAAAGR
jgi:hypothetical protein